MNQDNIRTATSQTPEQDDQKLVLQAKAGDQHAFSTLYDTYFKKVYNRVAYLIPAEDIEDVTQEVFIAMVQSLKTFRGDSKFSTWLRVITNRQIANYYRKNKAILTESDIEANSDSLKSKTMLADSSLNNIYLTRGLMELPEHYREILLMRFAEEMKFKHIAHSLGKSLDATKSLYRRAIETLRLNLGELHD